MARLSKGGSWHATAPRGTSESQARDGDNAALRRRVILWIIRSTRTADLSTIITWVIGLARVQLATKLGEKGKTWILKKVQACLLVLFLGLILPQARSIELRTEFELLEIKLK